MIFSFWKTVKCNHHVIIECFPVYLASRDLLRTQIFLSSILASKALFSQVSRAGGGGALAAQSSEQRCSPLES
jgi:hypothetical protein